MVGGPIYPSSYCCQHTLRSTFQRSRGIISKGWHLYSWNDPVPSCGAHSPSLRSLTPFPRCAPSGFAPRGSPLADANSITLLSLRGITTTSSTVIVNQFSAVQLSINSTRSLLGESSVVTHSISCHSRCHSLYITTLSIIRHHHHHSSTDQGARLHPMLRTGPIPHANRLYSTHLYE